VRAGANGDASASAPPVRFDIARVLKGRSVFLLFAGCFTLVLPFMRDYSLQSQRE
jgi:hypothetical protein